MGFAYLHCLIFFIGMKHILLFLAIIPFFGIAQITDNFSDGDFTANPA